MKQTIIILIISLIAIHAYSENLVELSGFVVFNETRQKVDHIEITFTSLLKDTAIYTDNEGFYKINLPKTSYSIMISNDSLIGFSLINMDSNKSIDLMTYYNYMNDYKIFRSGFKQIYKNQLGVLGLKENGEFRRTTFVCHYAAYSFIENGLYKINGDTLILKTLSIDSYNNLDNNLIGHIDTCIIKQGSIQYLDNEIRNRYSLIQFKEL